MGSEPISQEVYERAASPAWKAWVEFAIERDYDLLDWDNQKAFMSGFVLGQAREAADGHIRLQKHLAPNCN